MLHSVCAYHAYARTHMDAHVCCVHEQTHDRRVQERAASPSLHDGVYARCRRLAVSLDEYNTGVSSDIGDPSRQPLFRTTGVGLHVDIEYTNVPEGQSQPEFDHREVRARVTLWADRQWAGMGVAAPEYDALPTGSKGAQTYVKRMRYSQVRRKSAAPASHLHASRTCPRGTTLNYNAWVCVHTQDASACASNLHAWHAPSDHITCNSHVVPWTLRRA